MSLSMEEIARAFSGHRFSAAYPYLRDDIAWDVVGSGLVLRKPQVMQSCNTLAAELEGIDIDVQRVRVVVGEKTVVVDSVTRYSGEDPATVASCDIYEFDDGLVSAITSYNVELDS